MKRPKRDDMVVMATCQQTRNTFGITVQRSGKDFEFIWAFKINPDSVKREGFNKNRVNGNISNAAEFPGCPHCGAPSWYQCGGCNRFVCMQPGQKVVKCPECGNEGEVVIADDFDLDGGTL